MPARKVGDSEDLGSQPAPELRPGPGKMNGLDTECSGRLVVADMKAPKFLLSKETSLWILLSPPTESRLGSSKAVSRLLASTRMYSSAGPPVCMENRLIAALYTSGTGSSESVTEFCLECGVRLRSDDMVAAVKVLGSSV